MARVSNQEMAQRVIAEETRQLLRDPKMQRWLLRFFQKAALFQSTYSPDSRYSAYAEGRRGLGLQVLDELLAVDPDNALRSIFPNAVDLATALGTLNIPNHHQGQPDAPDPRGTDRTDPDDRDDEPFER